ncbi:glycosyltransferase family 10 [Methanocorpusculum sp. MG]|uniref:Glycosyltransferase family 10 n=1 Tax=Methanocorpusculum petauri TaxID=3002863 RepID=A0ABT4IGG3_9EURY|nr:glycosyltransferase family 10 [Methanocorpusculum petauri]MCZ0860830.1 glycosyltransferase family 10 [Methanocorpusculum petauri]
MLKIKVTYPTDGVEIPPPDIRLQTPNGCCCWGNCEFYINSDIEECDYWVVLYDLPEKDSVCCPSSNTIFVTGEPVSVKKYDKKFLRQFATVVTAQEQISHPHVIQTHQILPWYVHKTYDELVTMSPPTKDHLLSIVSSNKRFSKGHEQRYQFALALKSHFGDGIDLFGRGIRGFEDKWDVLAPYKYSIVIENSSSPYYVTEKLTEAFLSYTFPIYYGCTNLEEYYPRGSFERIDIWDIEGSIDIISKIIENPNHYNDHCEDIYFARSCYLQKYQIYPLLTNIVNGVKKSKIDVEFNCANNTIMCPPKPVPSDIIFKLRCVIGIIKNGLGINIWS